MTTRMDHSEMDQLGLMQNLVRLHLRAHERPATRFRSPTDTEMCIFADQWAWGLAHPR